MIINKEKQGFTLIEMLLYIALAGVILLAVSLFFSLALSTRAKSQSVAEVEQQGTAVLTSITQIIRNGTAITLPLAGAASSSLAITVPTGAKSPTIINSVNGVLQIKEGANSPINLTDSRVSSTNLIFTNLTSGASKGTVRIQFTLSRVNVSSTNEYNYTQNFSGSATLR